MLNLRNTTILFVVVIALMIIANFRMHISPWWYVGTALLYSLILFYGSAFVGSNFYMKTICSGDTSEKTIAITFDDGPLDTHTPEILDILKMHRTSAAFFCIGNRIQGNEEVMRRIQSEGHLIGNHSFSHHFWFDLFSARKMLNDLQLADLNISGATGLQPLLFRPPYGVTNPNLAKATKKGNYVSVGWNVRSLDTVTSDGDKLFKRVTNKLRPGAIILFHDTCKVTVDILPKFLDHVTEQGYRIVRLDHLLKINPYA